ncbi:Structural maintenance of chromosomes protein 5 [Coelomomyces lativittatus]|nr:Structural maintenance of chromosomes protein 5 [Coelomomyces lativittatus]
MTNANGLTEDDFPKGAIISIQVLRFMVYDEATFYMHPKLNMIIGPNGTGKSTVVCAIVIGLGSSPKLTGRGNELYDYVQNGHSKAVTNIKLSMGKGEPPVFIKRVLNKIRHSNDFFINKSKSTLAQVETLMKQLNIQVDNICQFLPQEKVSSLAAMDNVQLLHEVQLAAGSENMVQQHETLKELDEEIIGLDYNLSHLDEKIRIYKAKNDSIQAQYQNLQARLDLMKSLSLNTILVCTLKYEKTKVKLKELSGEKRKLDQQLKLKQKALEPMKNSFKNEQSSIQSMKSQAKACSDRLDKWIRKSLEFQSRITKFQEAQESLSQDLERWKQRKSSLEAFLMDLKREKETLMKLHERPNPVDPVALQELDTQLKEIQVATSQLFFEQRRLEDRKNEVTEKMQERRQRKEELHSKLSALQNQSTQTLHALKNYEPARKASEVHDWIQSHRHLFKSEVRGPMLLHIEVMHESLGHYVDAAIGRPMLLNTFLVENEEDYETLCHQFNDPSDRAAQKPISIHLHKMEATKPALPSDLIRRLGFEGVLSDVIVTDEFTKNWLLHKLYLQLIPYTLNHVNYDQVDQEPMIERYLAANVLFINRRVKSNPSAPLNTTSRLEKNRSIFRVGFINRTQAVQACEQQLQQCQGDLDTLLEEARVLTQKLEPLGHEKVKKEREKHVMIEKKKELLKLRDEFVHNQKRLESLETEMKEKEKKIEEFNLKIEDAKVKSVQVIHQKLELLAPWKEWLRCIPSLYKEKRICILQIAVSEHELRTRMQHHLESLEEIQHLEHELQKVTERMDVVRETAAEIREHYKSAASELNIEAKDVMDTLLDQERRTLNLPSKPVEEHLPFLERRQIDLQAQLNAMPSTDLQLIQVYEERVIAIQQSQAEKLSFQQSRDEKKNTQTELALRWLNQLDPLILSISETFSKYFSQLGCAGEILVHKPTRFKDYALQIRVKFRAAQEFQVLDKARQSGGVRF